MHCEVHCFITLNLKLINRGFKGSSKNTLNVFLIGDGSQYSKPSDEYLTGMSPEFVAERVVDSVVKGWKEVIVAPLFIKLAAVWLHFLFPSLFYYVMRKRSGLP